VVSVEGEKLELIKPLKVRGASEQWLLTLENSIFDTVKRYLKQGLADNQTLEFEEWLLKHIGQVVLTVGQINFNKKVLLSFSNEKPLQSLELFRTKLISSINSAANMASKDIPSYKVQSIEALLTIDVHSRDILTSLINNKITAPDDFEWTRNLRYEWEELNNQCSVLHSNAIFSYGYEYLGCSPRLVITPLTDRCYLTLTGALKLNLGGAPAGPAGTGKTETVKDLARSIGKLCLVFNCSESLDYKVI
jgi:dynein heavy chain, axonemal